jgi:hypothetical protein
MKTLEQELLQSLSKLSEDNLETLVCMSKSIHPKWHSDNSHRIVYSLSEAVQKTAKAMITRQVAEENYS